MDETSLFLTTERFERFRQVLAHRQNGLTVVLENVHDPHNISAVMRSCDAVGVKEIYVIHSNNRPPKIGHRSSASAKKWLKVNAFGNASECSRALRNKGFQIWTTHLPSDAIELYDMDLTKPVALVFGNEHDGISDELLSLSDGNFHIPMVGMIRSLNISVACAVTLYEAYRQRAATGMYMHQQISTEEAEGIILKWSER